VLKASTIQHSPKKYKNYLFMREEVDGKVVETELEENWHKNLNPDDKFYIIHILGKHENNFCITRGSAMRAKFTTEEEKN
jgi:predicted Fe-Mo cluster-binding NifX family protein